MHDSPNLFKEVIANLQAHIEDSVTEGLTELREQLLVLLAVMEEHPERFPIIRAQLLLLLRDHPELFDLVKSWLTTPGSTEWSTVIRGPAEATKGAESVPESIDPGLPAMAGGEEPAPVTRYTDIDLPSQVQVDERFTLIVNLTVDPSADSSDAQPLVAPLGAQIHCMVTPTPGLTVLNKRMQPLTVSAEDSRPVVFYLRATTAGEHQVQLDFWYDGQIMASSTQLISAVAEVVPVHSVHHAGPPLVEVPQTAPYPDLVMRISTLQNQLRYELSFGDLNFLSFQGEPLRADPEQFRYTLLKEIENLAKTGASDDDDVLRELTKIGRRLYRDLWPLELRREYRRFRHKVRTIQIISDEPWIPWELLKPYDDEDMNDIIDDDFLALQFEFARWFTPAPSPAAAITIDSLACIVPADSNLPAAQRELAFLQQLALNRALQDYTPASADKATVETLLADRTRPIKLWHFACHGDFDAASPGQSPLLLQRGKAAATDGADDDRQAKVVGVSQSGAPIRKSNRRYTLRPNDLVGPVTTRLKGDQPFVFLNACRVGSGGMGLTGVGGWAKVLVSDCGVGALLAPLWEINDDHAHEFAELFYGELDGEGMTVAAATRQARLTLRERHPNDPLWLAYSLYAHPNAWVRLE